jgi:hypothetical protein
MHIGYRQNGTSNHFYYTYTADGVTFAHWIAPSFTMGGGPCLVVGPDGHLYDIFSENHNTHYLSTAVAQ